MLHISAVGSRLTLCPLAPEHPQSAVSDLDEVVTRQLKVCGLEAMQEAFLAQYTSIATYNLYVPVGDFPDVLDSMDRGLCDVGLISTDSWEMIGARSVAHCNSKATLDVTLYSLGNAIPMSDELARPLQWAIDKEVSSGGWTFERTLAQNLFLPIVPAVCAFGDALAVQADADADNSPYSRRRQAEVLDHDPSVVGGPQHGPQQRRQLKAGGKSKGAAASAASDDGSAYQQLDIKGAAGPLIIGALTASLALLISMVERIYFVMNDPSKQTSCPSTARRRSVNRARCNTFDASCHATTAAADVPMAVPTAPSTAEAPTPIVVQANDVVVLPD